MQSLINFLTLRSDRMVRPWALAAPIIVLLVSIPLIGPLRHPDLAGISDEEQARLCTVQAIVEHHTLAIDRTLFAATTRDKINIGGRLYSDQPPMMAALLSAPYWAMQHFGLRLEQNPVAVIFLLTLIGVTIPVALAAGFIYKMGRIFELRRPWRAGLALVAVLGSGLISYSTVLDAHAPAAALLLAACACLVQVGLINELRRSIGWIALAGITAALAATIDPPAIIFAASLVLVAVSFRWAPMARVASVCTYLLGALIPIGVHSALTRPVTGEVIPLILGSQFDLRRMPPPTESNDEDDDQPTGFWRLTSRLGEALFGAHGIFSHFPVVVIGLVGIALVLHRHWPPATKMLATVTIGGGVAIVLLFCLSQIDWSDAMFATRWFVLFLPLQIFWAGAWMRRTHRPLAWVIAGVLLGFSIIVSLIGATGPQPRGGFDRYTAAGALINLIHPPHPPAAGSMLAQQ